MAKSKTKKHKEGPLEEKWQSYTGTGIAATKGKDAIALRERIGGGEFAIVMLYGGCWSNSPMKVLEEIKTPDLNHARRRFYALATERGFKAQGIRGSELLIPFLALSR